MAVVALSAVGQMFFTPAYPFWSLAIITVGRGRAVGSATMAAGCCLIGLAVRWVRAVTSPVPGLCADAKSCAAC